MNLLQGHDTICPHCGESLNLTLDLSVPRQSYVEDCPVCCQSMLVTCNATDGELDDVQVEAVD